MYQRARTERSKCTRLARWCYPFICKRTLLAHADPIKRRKAERADLEVLHFLAHGLEYLGVGDRGDRHLFLEDMLGLLIQLDPLVPVGGYLGLLHKFVVGRVAPFGVVAAFNRCAAVEHAEPVVGVTVVTGPAIDHHVMLASLGALDVLAPFIADDVGLDADLRPV